MSSWPRALSRATPSISTHTRAVLEALFVTFLWSSSYVFIKIGLAEIPALTFAGLRYALATVVLLPVFVRGGQYQEVRRADASEWALLLALGLLLYAVTQGAQFVALGHLRTATVSLMLTFTPVVVAAGGIAALSERPTARQWVGIGLLLVGAGLYFRPWNGALDSAFGLAVMGVGLLGNAGGSILGRRINRGAGEGRSAAGGPALSPVAVTTVSMGVGSAVLLATGIAVQGLPALSLEGWAIVAWLAVVNTAGAFTLWNRTLQTLSAVESSVVNNTMLGQVAVLGWLFLGEPIDSFELLGILAVAGGVLLVQVSAER